MIKPDESNPVTNVTIGTHSGTFHCDEALAIAMLKMLPKFQNATVVRTRDEAVLSTLSILVDVGGEYDPERMRFDHHQRSFNDTFSPQHTIKLSSAGLIYKHFGKDIIRQTLQNYTSTNSTNYTNSTNSTNDTSTNSTNDTSTNSTNDTSTNSDEVVELYKHLYNSFIKAIDAIDNGTPQYPDNTGEPCYRINTDLSSRVSKLNRPWNSSNADENLMFEKAVALTGSEFTECLMYLICEWLPAREIVKEAFSKRFEKGCPTGNIMVLERWCPWSGHLNDLEESDGGNKVLFVIYPDGLPNGTWKVQGVPVKDGQFACRMLLPVQWRGVQRPDIEGCTFVHVNGFIGGNKTLKGALEMARRTISGIS